jgi:hypothetical protein
MEALNFEQALKDFRTRTPFRQFFVELMNGRIIAVDHPEALITRHGQAAYIAPDGAPSLFDHQSVARIFYAKDIPQEVGRS